MLQMIDEASYQGLYWTAERIRAAGIAVVAVKATEGIVYANPDHSAQVAAARSGGAIVMHYHVARFQTPSEFSYFRRWAHLLPGDLVMLDIEPEFTGVLPPSHVSSWVGAWAAAARSRLLTWPVIYTPAGPIAEGCLESVRGQAPLFLAAPGADPAMPPAPPRPWVPVSFLQYGERSGTDIDSAYFANTAQLARLAIPRPAPGVNRDQALAAIETIDKATHGVNGVPAALETLTNYVETH